VSTRRAQQQLSPAEDRADEGVGKGSTPRADRVLPQSGQWLGSCTDIKDHGFVGILSQQPATGGPTQTRFASHTAAIFYADRGQLRDLKNTLLLIVLRLFRIIYGTVLRQLIDFMPGIDGSSGHRWKLSGMEVMRGRVWRGERLSSSLAEI
jgi:hypothetical protein